MIRELAGAILGEGSRVVGKAAERILSDPRGQEAVARAVGAAQRGARALGAVHQQALHALGVASRDDHQELRKQIARIKRKARELGEALDAQEGAEPPAAAGEGAEPVDARGPDAEPTSR